MDNEVVIKVKADDETGKGFDSARRSTKKLGQDIDDEVRKVGPKAGGNLGSGLLSGLKNIAVPGSAQAGIAIGAVLAPTIGGLVAAGVMGAAGGAGILGGLTVAAKDPAVKGAAKSISGEIGDDLKGAAKDFVPVALESLGKVKQAWKGVLPEITAIFKDSSKLVGPLLDGILSGATKIIGGVRDAVAGAQPVFGAFGRLFDSVGGAVGDLFTKLSDDAEAGAASVDDLADALVHTVEAIGYVTDALAKWKQGTEDLDGWIDKQRSKLEDKTGWDITADGMSTAERRAKDLSDALEEETGAHDDAAKAAEGQQSALESLAEEMKAQTDPVFALLRAQEDLTKAQKEVSEATKEHGKDSAEAREALRKLAEAAIKAEGAAGALGDEFDGHLSPELRSTLEAAGATKGEIDRLERQFREARGEGNKFAKTYSAKAVLNNYRDTKGNLTGLLRDLRNFDGTWTATMVTNYVRHGKPGTGGGLAHGGIKGAASGMVGNGMTMVGEYGPELVDLPPGAQVHSNPDTRRMLSADGGSGGPLEVVLRFDPAGAPEVVRGLMTGLRGEIRDGGGNVQTVLGQAGR